MSFSREILYGKNGVLEVLRAERRKIFKIYWARRSQDATSEELLHLARTKKIPIQEVSSEEIAKRSGSLENQGVAIEVSPFEYCDLDVVVKAVEQDPKGKFLVLLDEIQDPHNVGALIRTAHLCGASGLVLLKHRQALITNAVCKAAAGAEEYLPIVLETNLVNVMEHLKENGFLIWGACGKGGESIFKTTPKFPLALVLGSEGKGLRRLVKEHCDHLVTIPMEGPIDSFNVSVAGGILMAEIMRNRRLSYKILQ